MEHSNINDKYGSVLKADLILSDYTLSTDEEERRVLLNLLDTYIMEIDEPKTSVIFTRMVTTENTKEKELYTAILTDILLNLKGNTYPET